MSDKVIPGKPHDDSMRQVDADDPIGEIALLADDPDSDEADILRKLEALGAKLSPDEIFAVLVRYDTPDVLG
ncbi:hypothetical protein [Actinoplanes palleronii]|uniref:Uncharacterized protein n=1 Tax=Actinoplanes palleronii TaxID=113570 RepID=A0ABQ4BT47_9ACTN|nr:hypothetical protein [Actinoplanes palleronii]GIE73360.1 hypothetical protein Apa02nite_094680 [Actinoplanes palleronii]